jgi:hypothetical protein
MTPKFSKITLTLTITLKLYPAQAYTKHIGPNPSPNTNTPKTLTRPSLYLTFLAKFGGNILEIVHNCAKFFAS